MAVGDGTPGPGRPKGSTNKLQTQAKEAIALVFDKLGGVDALLAWTQKDDDNLKIFYTAIYPKLVPLQVNSNVDFVDRTESVRRAREEVRALFGERAGDGAGDSGRGLPH
jgi:hypothetical protein